MTTMHAEIWASHSVQEVAQACRTLKCTRVYISQSPVDACLRICWRALNSSHLQVDHKTCKNLCENLWAQNDPTKISQIFCTIIARKMCAIIARKNLHDYHRENRHYVCITATRYLCSNLGGGDCDFTNRPTDKSHVQDFYYFHMLFSTRTSSGFEHHFCIFVNTILYLYIYSSSSACFTTGKQKDSDIDYFIFWFYECMHETITWTHIYIYIYIYIY